VNGTAGEVEVLLGQRRIIKKTDNLQPRSHLTEHGIHCRS
jgi:hypothetical protein